MKYKHQPAAFGFAIWFAGQMPALRPQKFYTLFDTDAFYCGLRAQKIRELPIELRTGNEKWEPSEDKFPFNLN